MGFVATVFNTCSIPDRSVSEDILTVSEKPKNIILMIGDGMGLAQVSAALYTNFNQLNLEEFPVVGLHKSYSYDHLVTDSAAGATAFACGVKTYNNAIGVNKDTVPGKTILEEAEEHGLATGLIATSTIVHATPAAFISHTPFRENYEEAAADIMDTEVDLLIGGGKQYFERRESDDRNLIADLKKRGYFVSDYAQQDINSFRWNPNKNFVFFTADKHPLPVSARQDYLALSARQAPYFLEKRSEKGFFLMIEGSQIDWACHAKDAKMSIKETLDFDRAIGEVLKFAKSRGNTLVIVTADHETGGLALMPGSDMGKVVGEFTTNNHTASLIPVYAFGPSANLFAGIYQNTDIHRKMRELLNFDDAITNPVNTPGTNTQTSTVPTKNNDSSN